MFCFEGWRDLGESYCLRWMVIVCYVLLDAMLYSNVSIIGTNRGMRNCISHEVFIFYVVFINWSIMV